MANANRKLLFILLSALLFGCGSDVIQVDIDNPKYREVYIKVLEKNKMKFTIDDKKTIHIQNESEESLQKKMKEYEEYVDNHIRILNEEKRNSRNPD